MPQVDDVEVDLTFWETAKILVTCEKRLAEEDFGTIVEVLHQGVWKSLGRTDLMDDIRTYKPHDEEVSIDQVIEDLTEIGFCGARFSDHGFFLIDQFSDG